MSHTRFLEAHAAQELLFKVSKWEGGEGGGRVASSNSAPLSHAGKSVDGLFDPLLP